MARTFRCFSISCDESFWDIELNTCSIPCHTFAQSTFPSFSRVSGSGTSADSSGSSMTTWVVNHGNGTASADFPGSSNGGPNLQPFFEPGVQPRDQEHHRDRGRGQSIEHRSRRSCDPCVFYSSSLGCAKGDNCRFCHHPVALSLEGLARPRKLRRLRIKERLWQHLHLSNQDEMQEALQAEARSHPYARLILKAFLDECVSSLGERGIILSL